MINEELINRVKHFINELGVSRAAFAKNVGLAAVTIYKWLGGHEDLSEKTLKRIDEYLKRYNF